MYNAMMDPEIIRLAQEQMSKIPPAELARIQQQMFSNPELMKIATESIQNLRPEDVKHAAEQLKHTSHEDIAELTEKMANASPEELASLRARSEAQVSYQVSAAEMLKKQGNDLHASRKYHDAANKYLLAKDNLKGISTANSSTLKLQCSLNLMSCYLKTMQYEECVKEGSEVLRYDLKSVKALYRRGQAYKELGNLKAAVSDLSSAHEFSPDDETIAEVLRDAKKMLLNDAGVSSSSRGVVIEEIYEEDTRTLPSRNHDTAECSVTQPIEGCEPTHSHGAASAANSEALRSFKEDPETIRLFQKYVSNADTETLSSMGLGGMSPDVVKTATEMISGMTAEELQKMLEVASSLKDNGAATFSNMNGNGLGMSPELIRMASDKINRMSPEERKKMLELSSSSSASSSSLFNSQKRCVTSSIPSSTSGLQESLRNSMNDPAMQQMFTSMMKNMSPEMMSNMSEQFGMKLSKEDATKAQQAMASLSPEDLDRMMRWAEKAQKGFELAKKTKNCLLGKTGMILAIAMLILAVILHKLGYIGN